MHCKRTLVYKQITRICFFYCYSYRKVEYFSLNNPAEAEAWSNLTCFYLLMAKPFSSAPLSPLWGGQCLAFLLLRKAPLTLTALPEVLLGGQDTQWQERWLCPCCEPSSWGITPSHPAPTFSLGKPHCPYPWDRSNSGMELGCNWCAKSFTHSWFLPQPGLHFCSDILFGLFPFHNFPDSVFSLYWRANP